VKKFISLLSIITSIAAFSSNLFARDLQITANCWTDPAPTGYIIKASGSVQYVPAGTPDSLYIRDDIYRSERGTSYYSFSDQSYTGYNTRYVSISEFGESAFTTGSYYKSRTYGRWFSGGSTDDTDQWTNTFLLGAYAVPTASCGESTLSWGANGSNGPASTDRDITARLYHYASGKWNLVDSHSEHYSASGTNASWSTTLSNPSGQYKVYGKYESYSNGVNYTSEYTSSAFQCSE
jgi:hypothetical protein